MSRWLSISAGAGIAAIFAVTGCEGCGANAVRSEAEGTAAYELGPLPDEVPRAGAIYQEAYDEAEKKTNPENARDRLRDIERSVARERRELR